MAQLSRQQAKNLQKEIRLVNATTGVEQEVHMEKINKMLQKYNVIVRDDRLMSENEIKKDNDESMRHAFESHGYKRLSLRKRITRAIKRFFVKYF